MEEVEGALPVEVKLTGKAGVFLISEPKETTSSSTQSRLKFEYELSKVIRSQDWDACVENADSPNQQFFSIGNVSNQYFDLIFFLCSSKFLILYFYSFIVGCCQCG